MGIIIGLIIVIGVILVIYLLKMNKQSKLPEYLKGKHVYQYLDLMTKRKIYIAASKNKGSSSYQNTAYYMDDGGNCVRALVRQPYGFMYYENGELKVVPKSFALNLLERIKKATISPVEKDTKLAEDLSKNDEQENQP